MDHANKRQKGVKGHTIAICVQTRGDAYGEPPPEKGFISTVKKLYRPPLTSTYKET